MTNSRTRRRPLRGRGSSRTLVWKWYRICGSSRYERISRAWNVTVSSCVSARTNGRPMRSSIFQSSGIEYRPVCCQSSAGVTTGMNISWPPIAFISSRTIWTTFWWTRHPRGKYDHNPAPVCRMKPPRTSSLWLTASASPGSSRRVGMKSSEARIWLGRALGRFGHEKCSGLGELEALRPFHPAGDPLIDLVEELVHEDVGGDLLQHAPVRVDEACVAAPGDAEVGVAGLPRSVHGAAHDGDLECLRIVLQALLDHGRQLLDADVVAPTRGAGDHHW